jgi:hypothetical protein
MNFEFYLDSDYLTIEILNFEFCLDNDYLTHEFWILFRQRLSNDWNFEFYLDNDYLTVEILNWSVETGRWLTIKHWWSIIETWDWE